MADYTHVSSSNDLSEVGSLVNAIIIRSELSFTIIFTVEFALKATALGLFSNNVPDRKPYFRDRWNWLDFIVVVFALLANLNVLSSNSTKIFRLFRVLRPLKSIKSLPGVAAIVSGLLNSLTELRDILITVSFAFFFFAVVGLQLFSGPYLHTRCRLTPFPVNISWVGTLSEAYLIGNTTYPFTQNYTEYRCLDAPNFDYPLQYPQWQQSDSPWFTPQPHCYWPYDINSNNPQVCSLTGDGTNVCPNIQSGDDTGPTANLWRWCGSNYDALGNPRFNAATAADDTFNYNLGYGFVNFDNFAYALLFVIQVFSGDSWSFMMYQLTDSINVSEGVIYCSLIVLFGTFFLLQLNVALLEESFKRQKREKDQNRPFAQSVDYSSEDNRKQLNHSFQSKAAEVHSNELHGNGFSLDYRIHPYPEDTSERSKYGNEGPKYILNSRGLTTQNSVFFLRSVTFHLQEGSQKVSSYWKKEMTEGIFAYIRRQISRFDRPDESSFRRSCKALYSNHKFELFSLGVVIINTAMLAYNHYGIDPFVYKCIYAAEYVITIYSILESVLGLVGLGLINFFSNSYTAFDFAIVLLSSVASFASPLPCLFSRHLGCVDDTTFGAVLSLRSFRCFTIFRVLKIEFFKVSHYFSVNCNFSVLIYISISVKDYFSSDREGYSVDAEFFRRFISVRVFVRAGRNAILCEPLSLR